MPTLRHDIVSRFPGKKVYGKEGEMVDIISVSGHVFIVEGETRFRYPVLETDMNDIPAGWKAKVAPLPPVGGPARSAPAPIPNENKPKPAKARKSETPKKQDQGSLF
jgi:hypothetical protein